MTIERGSPWGRPWTEGSPTPEVSGDAELAAAMARPLLAGEGNPASPEPLTPVSGDLLRTIGVERPRPVEERHLYPIDLALAHLTRGDGTESVVPFVAHLTVRNRPLTGLGPGLSVAVMNAAWFGPLRLGPRAHPNDGRVDVTEGTVGLLQRREANRRAGAGAHLPHPRLTVTRAERWERVWPRPVPVWVDGVRRGRFTRIAVEVVADAGSVVA